MNSFARKCLQLWDVKEYFQKTKVCPKPFKAEDFY